MRFVNKSQSTKNKKKTQKLMSIFSAIKRLIEFKQTKNKINSFLNLKKKKRFLNNHSIILFPFHGASSLCKKVVFCDEK